MGRILCLSAMLALVFAAMPATAQKEARGKERKEAKGGGEKGSAVGPDEPRAPDVELREKKGAESPAIIRKVVVTVAGGATIGGELVMKTASVALCDPTGGGPVYVRIEEIESLEFTRWQEKPSRKNEFIFSPSSVRVRLRNGNSFECGGSFPSLHRLTLRVKPADKILYSYYYDYWRGGAWVNAGGRDIRKPDAMPLKGTVMKLDFK